MREHVKILSWLYIVLGILGVLIAGIVVLLVAGGGLISGDRTAILVTGIVAAVVGGFILLISVPGIIAGAALMNFEPWARIFALVLGVLNLPSFPIGTALGIYTLYVLLDDETSRMFTSGA